MSKAIYLPTLRISSSIDNLDTSVSSSICLDLPKDTREITSVNDLFQAVMKDHMWIARLGTCNIEVSFSINGDSVLDDESLGMVAESIASCEIWDRLGLRLEYKNNERGQLPGVMSFFIQHPDLRSALVAPKGSLVAQFRALILLINTFESIKEDTLTETAGKSLGKKRKRRAKQSKPSLLKVAGSDNIYSILDSEDQLAVETFVSSLNIPPEYNMEQVHGPVKEDSLRMTREAILGKICTSTLFGALFEQLILRPNKGYRGFEVSTNHPTHSLAQLAPGVFHMPYLKALSERATLMQVIATSLTRMGRAESPTLRQMIKSFGLHQKKAQRTDEKENTITQGLERQAWVVLMANFKIPPLKERRMTIKSRRQKTNQKQLATLAESQEPTSIGPATADRVLDTEAEESQDTTSFDQTANTETGTTNEVAHSQILSPAIPGTVLFPLGDHDNDPSYPPWHGGFEETGWMGMPGQNLTPFSDPVWGATQDGITATNPRDCVYDPGAFQSLEHFLSRGEQDLTSSGRMI